MNTATLVASLIMAAVLAVLIALLIRQMMRGWLRRAQRQAELIGTLPPLPDTVGRGDHPRDQGTVRRQHVGAAAGRTASRSATSATAPRRC